MHPTAFVRVALLVVFTSAAKSTLQPGLEQGTQHVATRRRRRTAAKAGLAAFSQDATHQHSSTAAVSPKLTADRRRRRTQAKSNAALSLEQVAFSANNTRQQPMSPTSPVSPTSPTSPPCIRTSAGTCVGEEWRLLTENDFEELLRLEPFPEFHKGAVLGAHRKSREDPPAFSHIRYKKLLPILIPMYNNPLESFVALSVWLACLIPLLVNRRVPLEAKKLWGKPEPVDELSDELPGGEPEEEGEPEEGTAAPLDRFAQLRSRFARVLITFWWEDVEPLENLAATMSWYFLIVTMQLQNMSRDYERHAGSVMMLPSIAMLHLAVRRSLIGSWWHVLANVILTACSGLCIWNEWQHTAREGANTCSHKYLPLSWALLGIVIASWAALVVPEREVSRYLRKIALAVCAVVYINGGLSKVLNNHRPWEWAKGGILRYFIYHSYHEFHTWGSKWPWLSRFLVENAWLGVPMASAVLFWELVLSALALLGITEFGRFGPLRYIWSICAFGFHFGVLLLMRPFYDIQAWIVVCLVLDIPMRWLPGLGTYDASDASGAAVFRMTASRAVKKGVKLLVAVISTAVVLAWLFVGLAWHHVDKDPNWPISSVPMYSTLFYLDPSTRLYSRLLVFDVDQLESLKDADKDAMFTAELEPLNATSAMIEYFIDSGILVREEGGIFTEASGQSLNFTNLAGLNMQYHRCFSPHFRFASDQFLGMVDGY